jgi:hypothetical protein
MKKTILLLATVLATAASYGQGQFTFDNFSGTATPNLTTIASNSVAAEGSAGQFLGSSYSVSLYWMPGTVSQSALDAAIAGGTANLGFSVAYGLGAVVPNGTDNTTGAGYFAYVNPADQSSTVVVPGQSGTITVEADAWWTAAGGYLQALNGGFNSGHSVAASIALATGTQLVPNMNEVVPSFTVGVVPEPTTLALCGLGAASLLLLRRKK